MPLAVRLKSRLSNSPPNPNPPPTCEEIAGVIEDPDNPTVCRRTICAADEDLSADGNLCIAKCKFSYTDKGTTCVRENPWMEGVGPNQWIEHPPHSYVKRAPRPVIWGIAGDSTVSWDVETPRQIIPGQTIRLASITAPSEFINHSQYLLYVSSNIGFAQDSYFTVEQAADGGAGVSFRSSNFPDRLIRHKDYRLVIEAPDGGPSFAGDSSFIIHSNNNGSFNIESASHPGYFVSTGSLLYAREIWLKQTATNWVIM